METTEEKKKTVNLVKSWEDWDKPGIKIAVTLGANSDMFVTEKFKKAVALPGNIANKMP